MKKIGFFLLKKESSREILPRVESSRPKKALTRVESSRVRTRTHHYLDQISLCAWGGIRLSLTRFLFGVGSLIYIEWIIYYSFFQGGISYYLEDSIFWDLFYLNILSMPQVFEQSPFLLIV